MQPTTVSAWTHQWRSESRRLVLLEDYRGEPNPMVWPATGSQFGILDYCCCPKDEAFSGKAQVIVRSVEGSTGPVRIQTGDQITEIEVI